jgi:predicted ATPase
VAHCSSPPQRGIPSQGRGQEHVKRALELWVVMSLSRLWHGQGKPAGVRQVLAEMYGWFTEGFDTADLKEARALLEAM